MNRFIMICAIVLMAAPVAAFAQAGSTGGTMGGQAGSTGGTIGKVDKEASGGEVSAPRRARRAHVARRHYVVVREQRAPHVRRHHVSEAALRRREAQASATRSTGCPNIVGVWNSWASGLFGQADTTFYKNGTAMHRSGIPGKWWCEGGGIHMQWGGNDSGIVKLSPDGKKLIGPSGGVGFFR